jgi:hypothetical protein
VQPLLPLALRELLAMLAATTSAVSDAQSTAAARACEQLAALVTGFLLLGFAYLPVGDGSAAAAGSVHGGGGGSGSGSASAAAAGIFFSGLVAMQDVAAALTHAAAALDAAGDDGFTNIAADLRVAAACTLAAATDAGSRWTACVPAPARPTAAAAPTNAPSTTSSAAGAHGATQHAVQQLQLDMYARTGVHVDISLSTVTAASLPQPRGGGGGGGAHGPESNPLLAALQSCAAAAVQRMRAQAPPYLAGVAVHSPVCGPHSGPGKGLPAIGAHLWRGHALQGAALALVPTQHAPPGALPQGLSRDAEPRYGGDTASATFGATPVGGTPGAAAAATAASLFVAAATACADAGAGDAVPDGGTPASAAPASPQASLDWDTWDD